MADLLQKGKEITEQNWQLQQEAGIDIIPSNDFSYYDQILDMSLTVGAIPKRYNEVVLKKANNELDLYFAMARGYQKDGLDITAMEMTKWFDTNYHYIVPEFFKDQSFSLFSDKVITEFVRAKQFGIISKPVIIGPVSYLLLGKAKEASFDKIDLIRKLSPVYLQLLGELKNVGAEWIQLDEPFLALDIDMKAKEAFIFVYAEIRKQFPNLKILVATYFEGIKDNLVLATKLPITALHIDLVRCPEQLDDVLNAIPQDLMLSLGLVDGRNIWRNDYELSLSMLRKASEKLGSQRLLIAPSCSLLHSPCDLDLETDEGTLKPEIKQWLAFARQKLDEVAALKNLMSATPDELTNAKFAENKQATKARKNATLIHDEAIKQRIHALTENHYKRLSTFSSRKKVQHKILNLPLFPTTTIGSFPQTSEVRTWRSKFKKGEITRSEYEALLKKETEETIRWQEEIGIDVLVHGEFERNDMVEYFGEQLNGFVFTNNGWVQSYGSRCVKPPIIYGDISRPKAMTVYWTKFAQSLTKNLVKGMLTGPVTILQWSFVRNDQPRSVTCNQIALAIRDEVIDLENAGIRIIQIDEPAIREGLPLRMDDWNAYLTWAINAFKIAASGVKDETQIHTHMCYSDFNDIISHIADMDADVITIECSRSQMELLDAFAGFNYPNEIGPGVYDIHSPRIPSEEEIVKLLEKAKAVIPADQLWVNPDCGLKTRHWAETKQALIKMVAAAQEMRKETFA
ncbi:5-methyltetrahydropteroyltriglutamate--homocysteine methyltransferase [Pedobacter sp. UYEF25]